MDPAAATEPDSKESRRERRKRERQAEKQRIAELKAVAKEARRRAKEARKERKSRKEAEAKAKDEAAEVEDSPAPAVTASTATDTEPAPSGRAAKREQKKREREARKEQLKAEREQARQERLKAIEERRAARAVAKAKKKDEPAATPAAEQPTAVAPAAGTGESGSPAAGLAAAAAAGAGAAALAGRVSNEELNPEATQRVQEAESREEDALVQARVEQSRADAERRVREIDRVRLAAEGRVAEEQMGVTSQPVQATEGGEESHILAEEMRLTDAQIERRRRRDQELLEELAQAERRIETNRSQTEGALEAAKARIELLESQAGEAEQRAARAEHLAKLREQEAERERRLHEMLERINEAERRAREAEMRAREAVAGVARPLESEPLPAPLPPEPEPEPISHLAESKGTAEPAAETGEGLGFRTGGDEGSAETAATGVLPGSPADRDPDEGAEAPAAPDFEGEGSSEGAGAEPATAAAESDDGGSSTDAGEEGAVSLNTASFEQLRNAGLSVTQTGRVLAHRERAGGFSSVDELDDIPGFPQEFLDEVKPRLTA